MTPWAQKAYKYRITASCAAVSMSGIVRAAEMTPEKSRGQKNYLSTLGNNIPVADPGL